MERGNVYYAKLARGKTMFLAPRMIPHFHAVWGRQQSGTTRRLSVNARAILRALRREWELGSADLRGEAGITNRRLFNRALDELQAAMIVIPSQVVYQPRLTYIWTLGVSRFPELLSRSIARRSALREIARCFLAGAGMTIPGDLARFTGLSRQEAARANRELLADGFATTPRTGVYRLADTEETPAHD
ncbi:MAG: crosslink repair DNA glycosylase YcaQ family protein [Acidobacteriota bacterium]|nr:crosslink repair DNA glycosylase YcaQ family protein [Acidobacteriota bacterium]